MPVSGPAVGAVTAGSLLLYAGLKGYSIPRAVQAVISGKPPSAGGVANPITGGAAATTAAAAGGGSPSRTGWAKALLGALGCPATAANVNSIVAWEDREGGGGANNPLNTTLPEPGSTALAGNSAGVQNYPSYQEGVDATAATLQGGQYGDILMCLQSGQGFLGVALQGLSIWSGGGYSSVG